MEVVVHKRVCDLHQDRDAKLQGFIFFDPDTGLWYESDLCDGHTDVDVLVLLRELARVGRGEKKPPTPRILGIPASGVQPVPERSRYTDKHPPPRLSPPADVTLPPGWEWWQSMNSSGAIQGRVIHATADRKTSRCNLLTSTAKGAGFTGPPEAGVRFCGHCIRGLRKDALMTLQRAAEHLEHRRRVRERKAVVPDVTLPEDMKWWQADNGHGGRAGRVVHATWKKTLAGGSLCLRVTSVEKWTGPPDGEARYCMFCVKALELKARKLEATKEEVSVDGPPADQR